MSPFTARLVAALRETAEPDDDGWVSSSSVITALEPDEDDPGPRPHAWGSAEGVPLARRPGYALRALQAAGLTEAALERRGAALGPDGNPVHLEVAQVSAVIDQLVSGHPTTAFVSGPVGSGKTWILCEVRDRLAARGWQTRTLVPTGEPEDAHRVRTALRRYVAEIRSGTDTPCLLVIDGIEWSDAWAEVVSDLHLLAVEELAVGVLGSLEIQRGQVQHDNVHRSWATRDGGNVQALTQRTLPDVVTDVVSPERSPRLAGLTPEQLERKRAALIRQTGTDMWAVVHLGLAWGDPDAERRVIERVWEQRLGQVDRAQLDALHRMAALGRFNLWCPLHDALPAGQLIVELGAEYSVKNDAVRLNSGLLCRAILARQIRRGRQELDLDPRVADRTARPILARYVRHALLDQARQDDVILTLSRLRYDARVFGEVVGKLTQGSEHLASPLMRWAEDWSAIEPAVRILEYLAPRLPTELAAELGERLCALVVEHVGDAGDLHSVVRTMELLRRLTRGRRRPPRLDEAREHLVTTAERLLGEGRWPASLRRRLLRVLRQTNLLDEDRVARIGPLALRPQSPPVVADIVLAVDFARLVTIGPGDDAVREVLSEWDVVIEDLVRAPEGAEMPDAWGVPASPGDPELMGVRAVLARQIGDTTVISLENRTRTALRAAGPVALHRALSTIRRLDKRFVGGIVAGLDVDSWSSTVFRSTTPYTVASLVSLLIKIRPDLAVRTVYRDDEPDGALVESLATTMQRRGDAVSASMLLRSVADVEEQRGLLDEGFAQLLARTLGTKFLLDTLESNTRLTIVAHLVAGYAKSRTDVLETIREQTIDIVATLIDDGSNTESGPRLALILSDDDALGESFLDQLRTRPSITQGVLLDRMTNTANPAALAAYHDLGVALFPGIEKVFAEKLEEGGESWTRERMFDDLGGHGDVVLALRAARAVTATLTLSGTPDAGEAILGAFGRGYQEDRPGGDWPSRVFEADDTDLAEALRHLAQLSTREAARVVESASGGRRLRSALRRSPSDVVADLVAAVSTISTVAGGELVDNPEVGTVIEQALDDLLLDGDLFVQGRAMVGLAKAEDWLGRLVVPETTAEEFRRRWIASASAITNPGLVATLIRAAGNAGGDAAHAVAGSLDVLALSRRLGRRNGADAAGFGQLVNLLGELVPARMREVLGSETNGRWLLAAAPPGLVPGLASVLAAESSMTVSEIAAVVSVRRAATGVAAPMRHRFDYWRSAGWIAWAMSRLGRPFDLLSDLDERAMAAVDPVALLRVGAWVPPRPETTPMLEAMLDRVLAGSEPPSSPEAMATVLIACAALRREPPRYGADALGAWQRALDVSPRTVLALLDASRSAPWLAEAFVRDWAPWATQRLRLRLIWQSHGWRAQPTEALRLLSEVERRRSSRAGKPVKTNSSAWQRAE